MPVYHYYSIVMSYSGSDADLSEADCCFADGIVVDHFVIGDFQAKICHLF